MLTLTNDSFLPPPLQPEKKVHAMLSDTNFSRERDWRNGLKARTLIADLGLTNAELTARSELRAAGLRWRRRAHWGRILKHIRAEAKRLEGAYQRMATQG